LRRDQEEIVMVVVDVLLVCNLILFACCALRSSRADSSRADQLLQRIDRPGDAFPAEQMGQVLRFPPAEDLAMRRARALHPSQHPSVLSARPLPHSSARSSHPSGRLG